MLRQGAVRALRCCGVLSPLHHCLEEPQSCQSGLNLSRGFLSWLSQPPRRLSEPLNSAIHGVKSPDPFPYDGEQPNTETTTLSNGIRIVSEASPGPTASLAVCVNSGSIYETPRNSGATMMLESLAFKTTKHRSMRRLLKEIEKMGAHIMANASREQMLYSIDCLKNHVPEALELICDSVMNPAFNEVEVAEQKSRIQQLLANPEIQQSLLSEFLLRSCYQGALANPLIADPSQMDYLTPEVLTEFVQQNYTASRMVVAGAGVDHDQLVKLCRPMVEPMAAVPAVPEPSSTYVGGSFCIPCEVSPTNLILGFEYPGGWRNVHGAVVMTVVSYLLGGGSSFSSGGPGKGMHSRLYTRVLNQFSYVHSCQVFASTSNNSGVFGIHASCEPTFVDTMVNLMCTELEALTRPVPAEELERAKNSAISLIFSTLESKALSAEDIGRQYLTYGYRISRNEYLDMLRAVNQQDVVEFATGLLNSRPSLATYGQDAEKVNYDAVQRRFSPGYLNRVRRLLGHERSVREAL